jgi:hypothetical protein
VVANETRRLYCRAGAGRARNDGAHQDSGQLHDRSGSARIRLGYVEVDRQRQESVQHQSRQRLARTDAAHAEHQCVAGHAVLQPGAWRVYSDCLASIEDHANFLLPTTNPRYAPAFARCDNGEAFAVAVAAPGYATDPNYAAKLIATMRSHNLKQFDQPQGATS